MSTHTMHLSKEAVPKKAQSWTNKIKCSKTLPKAMVGSCSNFKLDLTICTNTLVGVQQIEQKKHTSWID